MEWGLRKVLPSLTRDKKVAFAFHILPVIMEECFPEMSAEEIEAIMDALREKVQSEEA